MLDSDHERNFGKVVRELPKVYDDALKKLLKANTQDFVDLLQKGMYVEEALPTELDAEHVYADGLIRCHDQHGKVQLAHLEFQRENDDRMGERLLEYNVLASHYNDYLPVASCVIYLKKGLKPPRPPFIRRLTDGTPTTHFIYASI